MKQPTTWIVIASTLLCVSLRAVEFSPFGAFAAGDADSELQELGASSRMIVAYHNAKTESDQSKLMEQMDASILKANAAGAKAIVISLVSDLHPNPDNYQYTMLNAIELAAWNTFVGKLVERYDGDDNYGCKLIPSLLHKDCYRFGDGLYPSALLKGAITNYPIKHWQIENEWGSQIREPNGEMASKESLLELFKSIKAAIKAKDPNAQIILARIGVKFGAFLDGYDVDGFIDSGETDCAFGAKRKEQLSATELQGMQADSEFSKFFLKEAAPLVDIFDFHEYDNEPLETAKRIEWMRKNMSVQRPIWSLEYAGPFTFYQSMGVPQPGPSTCTSDRKFEPYSYAIQSDHLLKRFAIGLAAGAGKIFYSSVKVATGWSANYQRLALVDSSLADLQCTGGKKPAYYTFKLTTEKLDQFATAVRRDDETYEFKFLNRESVFVLWRKQGRSSIPPSSYLPMNWTSVKVTPVIDKTCATTTSPIVMTLSELDAYKGGLAAFIEQNKIQSE